MINFPHSGWLGFRGTVTGTSIFFIVLSLSLYVAAVLNMNKHTDEETERLRERHKSYRVLEIAKEK